MNLINIISNLQTDNIMMIIRLIICIPFCIAANVSDHKELKIPNKLVITVLCVGLVLSAVYGIMHGSFVKILIELAHWAMGLIPAFILMPFYILRMIGAGDIKFFSAIGGIVGWKCSILIIIMSFIASGIIGIAVIIHRRALKTRMKIIVRYLKMCFLTQSLMEYDAAEGSNGDSGKFAFSYGITIAVIASVFIYGSGYGALYI